MVYMNETQVTETSNKTASSNLKGKRQIVAIPGSAEINGERVEILNVRGWHGTYHNDGSCALCGLKIRNGNHSWFVQIANGHPEGATLEGGLNLHDGQTLLPTHTFYDHGQASLGFYEIGSECRKRLPQTFVTQELK